MRIMPNWTRLWCAPLVVLVITAGCGKDPGSIESQVAASIPDEPFISGLRITALDPERVNTPVRYSAQIFVFDFQGDVVGGTCEIDTSVGKFSRRIDALPRGVAVCEFTILVSTPQQIPGSIAVIDRGGHRSNSLTFVLGITA